MIVYWKIPVAFPEWAFLGTPAVLLLLKQSGGSDLTEFLVNLSLFENNYFWRSNARGIEDEVEQQVENCRDTGVRDPNPKSSWIWEKGVDTAAHQAAAEQSQLSPWEANLTEPKCEAPVIHNINPTIIPGECLPGKARRDLEVMDAAASARGKKAMCLSRYAEFCLSCTL